MPTSANASGDDLLNRLGLGGDLLDPTRAVLDAVALNLAADARATQLAEEIRPRIGHFLGQEGLLQGDDRGTVAGVEGAVPLVAFIRTAPDLEAYWESIGYPDDTIASTLADLGRQVRKTMAVTGRFGLGQADWLEMIWRGGFAQLGRLQFEIRRSALGAADAGEGALVLSTHIPPTGPMTPDAVDASFRRARDFFPAHFGELAREEGAFEVAVCFSWLLDAELMARMPGSNMDLFARRWTVWECSDSDGGGMFFGFDRPNEDGDRVAELLDDLPYDTRLHRTMIDVWRSGGHIHGCSGWLTLPDS